MIPQEIILEVRKKANIVDIISEYIPLIQKGKNYFGLCPFHDDHNPSMSVSPEKQIYTCFVCGASGNVFTFLMEYEKISFVEAVKIVGNKVGINIDINTNNKIIKDDKNKKIYNLYDITTKFYKNNLNSESGKSAKDYLKKRKITKTEISEFEIGLSLKSELTNLFIEKGYSNKELLESGISSSNDNKMYDYFSNRIMFPIWNEEGRVVAFSGRAYDEKTEPKYINSKESIIFKKSNILYNYHKAKEFARREKQIIITEGFMDVIKLYSYGIKNVIATMGTAITSEHAKLIKKLATNVILCFDGDYAGEKATISCSEELLKNNINPKIIRLEDGLDPDDYINKNGIENFKLKIDKPLNYWDYKIDYYKKNTNFENSEEVSNYATNVISELEKINDKVIKEILIKKLSEDTNISEATLFKMLNKNKNKIFNQPKKNIIRLNKYEIAERRMIFYMLNSQEVIKIYEKNKCFFPNKEYRALANEIIEFTKKYNEFNIANFYVHLENKDELIEALSLVTSLNINEKYTIEEISDYINLLNEYNIEQEIIKLNNSFKKEIDSEKKTEIAKKISELKKRRKYE